MVASVASRATRVNAPRCTSYEGAAILRTVMAHEMHAEGPHPELPPVHDEAADSPNWLPVAGLALLAMLGLFVAYRAAQCDAEAAAAPAAAGLEAVEVAPVAE